MEGTQDSVHLVKQGPSVHVHARAKRARAPDKLSVQFRAAGLEDA